RANATETTRAPLGALRKPALLQWSRRANATETSRLPFQRIQPALASMEPSRERDGDTSNNVIKKYTGTASMEPSRERDGDRFVDCLGQVRRLAASMEPSRERDGDCASAVPDAASSRCFNGAVARTRRRRRTSVAPCGGGSMLQWSRRANATETEASAGRAGRRARASMEPSRERDGDNTFETELL